mmetsp:Transcript_10042/g.19324  ORF Transcript_10042/g.19324 Transcript_10042/m.19324 type:complete len:124 (-) Transcript_10042:171-542(-)
MNKPRRHPHRIEYLQFHGWFSGTHGKLLLLWRCGDSLMDFPLLVLLLSALVARARLRSKQNNIRVFLSGTRNDETDVLATIMYPKYECGTQCPSVTSAKEFLFLLKNVTIMEAASIKFHRILT